MSHQEATNAHVLYNGKKYFLIQRPHCDVPLNACHGYQALAENEEGGQILVMWNQYADFDGDDEGEACDWDKYEIKEL